MARKYAVTLTTDGALTATEVYGKDRDHEACRSLWVAVIQKAIKDMAYSSQKSEQPSLTPSEREKLHRIYELEAPESFFNSNWFEEICLFLELSPSRIRNAVFDRYEGGDPRVSASR